MEELEQLGIIPVDYSVLSSIYSAYSFPRNKIANLEKAGKIIRLKRGMYVVSPDVSKQLLSKELIATPEKALCDMITTTPQLRIQSEKALLVYLEEDLRFDMSALDDMDTDIIKGCVKAGKKKTMLKLLLNLLQR